MDIGHLIAALRRQKGMTQEQLAQQLSTTRQAISKWESGKSTPDIDICVKLCEVLSVTPNRLLLGTEVECEAAPQSKKNHGNTIFIISLVFLLLVCICGTIMLVCNLYNGKTFEPYVHTQAVIMIWSSILAFCATLLYHSFAKHKSKNRHES